MSAPAPVISFLEPSGPPPGFGLGSCAGGAAFERPLPPDSARGLAHSKTLARGPWAQYAGAVARAAGGWLAAILWMFGSVQPGQAAAPTLDHFHPVAVQAGTTNVITAIGTFDPWPPRVWVDDPSVRLSPGANKGQFLVEVDARAPVGPHLVRVHHPEGASRPRVLIVDAAPQTAEVEPNDASAAPQVITGLPAVVNGRLDKSGDVDSYGVTLQAGQTLVASVDAYVLESPLDAVVRVTDARGVEQAWNHDDRTLDPRVVFTAPAAGRYVVQVMGFPHPATSEIRFHGSEKCIYRLQLHAGPYVAHTLPLGMGRSGRTRCRLAGWNLPAGMLGATELAVDPPVDASAAFAWLRVAGVENTVRVPVGDGPDRMEVEPNDRPSEANAFEAPWAVTGCLQRGDDEDRYRFVARKGERWRWTVQAVALGFPLDAWVRIENTNGTQVARSEGANGVDPELTWAPDNDGTFQAVVGSLIHRGGSNGWYRLSGSRQEPDFKVAIAQQSFVFKAGTTNEIKVNVSRIGGYTNAVSVRADGLPDSVAAAPVDVSEKGGEVVLKAVIATNAPAFGGVFRIVAGAGANVRPATFSFVSTSEDNGVPGGFRELLVPSTDQLWLTVKPTEGGKADDKKQPPK